MESLVSAADRYHQIEREILVGRARGTLNEAQEDDLLEESDALWLLLSAEERREVEDRIRVCVAADAPTELGLVDLPVEVGHTDAPRAAA